MTKTTKIIYWVATLWLSLGMVSTGLVQLFKAKDGPGGVESMAHLGFPPYLGTMIGVSKILGVVVLLIPGYPRLKEWAYAGFFSLMAGAIFSHIAMHDGMGEIFPALLLLMLTGVSYYTRPPSRKMVLAIN